jgi:hypothetical protein
MAPAIQGERDVDRLVLDYPFVADVHAERIEKDDRIAGLERPGLPFLDLVEGQEMRNGRNLGAVELAQMRLVSPTLRPRARTIR